MRRLEIAIAGAGPAGLAAALYLHRQGHKVRIFERFAAPKPLGSGLILQPTGLTILNDLGLLADILALGAPIERLYGADAKTGRTVLDVRYDAVKGGRFGLAVHRAALFGVLYRAVAAAGIDVATDTALADVEVGSSAVLVDEAARRIGGFDLVVDASGTRSALRRRAEQPCDPRPLPYGAFWASLPWPSQGFDPRALLQRYERASVMVGVMPIGRPEPNADPMAAFFWSVKPNDANAMRAAGIDAWKERVRSLWPACATLLERIDSFEAMTLARYGHHTLARPVGRRLAVIGDAAHSTSPQLGQGANMALLDARGLAYAVERHADVDTALDAYAASRRRHVRAFQLISRLFTPFYQSDSRTLPFVRDRLVATLARVPPAPAILATLVSGTIIDPFAPIGLDEHEWSGSRARRVYPR